MPLPSQASLSSTSTFRVRLARRGDGEQLGLLLAELGHGGAGDTATVHWVLSHPEIEVHVAADGSDRPLGLLSFSHRPQLRLSGRIATIDELVVSRAWRRKGVGRELLKRAIDRAKVLGVKRLEIQTLEGGEDATPFLAACGLKGAELRVFKL